MISDQERHSPDDELVGLTCLAGDVIASYSFPAPLQPGQRLVFADMAQYSMVKTNTFNGVRLPLIYRIDVSGKLHFECRFGDEDFAERLAWPGARHHYQA